MYRYRDIKNKDDIILYNTVVNFAIFLLPLNSLSTGAVFPVWVSLRVWVLSFYYRIPKGQTMPRWLGSVANSLYIWCSYQRWEHHEVIDGKTSWSTATSHNISASCFHDVSLDLLLTAECWVTLPISFHLLVSLRFPSILWSFYYLSNDFVFHLS